MSHKTFILHFAVATAALIAAIIAAIIGGEFYLSTLLIASPVYFVLYGLTLAIRYRRAPFRKAWLHYPLLSLLLYLLTFAFAWRTYHGIDNLTAAQIAAFPVCPAGEICAPQVIQNRRYLDRHYLYERDSRCVSLRSPGYALVKANLHYCHNEGTQP